MATHRMNVITVGQCSKCAVSVLLMSAALMLVAAWQPPAGDVPGLTGWVVVEPGADGDDTRNIQSAIDLAASTGGTVFFSAGHYRHTGLIGRANVHLKGAHVSSVRLDYTPQSGNGITLVADPDNFMVSDLTLTSSGRSSGWAIQAQKGTQRSLRIEKTNLVGFENGIQVTNALCVSISQCRIGHTWPADPRGIGLQFGNGRNQGGNGVTVEDCYLSSLDTGIVTHA
ncbi:MAG: glycosyl hydrolase family 28-related protein, partial [Planctomycetaceae bacterium]